MRARDAGSHGRKSEAGMGLQPSADGVAWSRQVAESLLRRAIQPASPEMKVTDDHA